MNCLVVVEMMMMMVMERGGNDDNDNTIGLDPFSQTSDILNVVNK